MEPKIKKEEEIEETIRAEEVEEIMERMPKSLIKWGSGAVVILILILIGLSAIIQYPDTISGAAMLTTKKPPVAVISNNTGIIDKLFVSNNESVEAETILAILKNRTDYNIVLWIDSLIFSYPTTERSETVVSDSIPATILDYDFWINQESKFGQLGELTYSFSGFLSSLREFKTANTQLISIEAALQVKEKGEKELYEKAWFAVMQLERLKTSVLLWKDKYLLKAPIEGKVSFQYPRVANQELHAGEEFCKIISGDKQVMCKVLIPPEGSAKATPGQKVRIVLASYPENEFGFIEGTVKTVSATPLTNEAGNNFIVTVNVPQPLLTSVKKEIDYLPEMQASAEIITEKRTILGRITDVLVSYWKKSE